MNSKINIQNWPEVQEMFMGLSCQSIECRELIEDIPALFWLVACYATERELSSIQVQKLATQKRRDILQIIIGKGSNPDIRFLKKLEMPDGKCKLEHLQLIIKAIENDIPFKLRHIKSISIYLIGALDLYSKLIDAKFIGNLISKKYLNRIQLIDEFQRASLLWDDIIGLGELLGLDSLACLINCPSIEAMRKLHDRWTVRVNSNADLVASLSQFPEAPIKGNDTIIQIRNEEDLLAEGRLMHHCVGGYAERLSQGACYIFRVLNPQRATLEICWQDRSVRIGSFKLANNRMPSGESYNTVNTWIEKYLRDILPECAPTPQIETFRQSPSRGNSLRHNYTKKHLGISARRLWNRLRSREHLIDYDIPVFYPRGRA